MPVVTGTSNRRCSMSHRRVVGFAGLWVLLLLPLLAPCVAPLSLHVGDRWLCAYTDANAPPPRRVWGNWGDNPNVVYVRFWSVSMDDAGVEKPAAQDHPLHPYSPNGDERLVATAEYRHVWIAFGRLRYGMQLFRGYRVAQ